MCVWTWEEVLRMHRSKCAGPVSAFQFQKAPLAPYWDRMTNVGMIGEVDLDAGLESSNSYKERFLSIGGTKRRKRNQSRVIPYWFVKVVQIEGYLLKVRFLGFPSNLEDKVTEQEKWICYDQLKSIGYYVDNGGKFTVPPLSDDTDTVPEPKETILERLREIVGMRTVDKLITGRLTEQDKKIRWKKSTKVEVQNEACCTEMLPGKISKTIGRRVQVMYCGSPVFKGQGIWVHEDSDLIQLEGWANTAGKRMNASVTGYDPAPLEPSKLTDRIREGAKIKIEVDMMFELINPLKLDEIAVGRVVKVLRHGYFICKIASVVSEGDLSKYVNGVNEFHFHVSSQQLFPLGSFAGVGETPSPRPSDAEDGDQFAWASYLERNGYKELPLPHKNNAGHGFEENMLIEAVDSHQSEFVCPAQIVKIVHPHAMKVHFLGWGPEFDQWKPIKTLEIYPVGWCQFRGYPLLEPPPEPEPEPEPTAPVGKNTKSGVRVKNGRARRRKVQPTGAVLADEKNVGTLTVT